MKFENIFFFQINRMTFLQNFKKNSRAEIDSGSETIINEVHNQEINVRQ